MREIKNGEIVRFKDGKIQKVDKDDAEHLNIFNDNVAKHSKNIIDLIEVGDVLEVYFPFRKITRKVCVDEYFKDSLILNGIISKSVILKQILTKEQFMRNCYEVENKDNGI